MSKRYQDPLTEIRKPALRAPADSCDCHAHMFGLLTEYPVIADARFSNPRVGADDYRKIASCLGIARTVIVQPHVYGADNRCAWDILEQQQAKWRDIAVLDLSENERTLTAMHVAGFRGVRVNLRNKGGLTMHALMVKPGFPAKTLPEFIAYAKQRPGKVSVGSTTSSVQTQIATLNKLAGIDLLMVPYKGIPATITDVIGGTLDATIVDLANAQTQAKAGKLVPIAVTSLQRNPLVPDWPAISETLPGFDFPSWVGLVGPAGMSRELVDKLNAAVAQAVRHPDVASRLGTIGMAPMLMSPDQFKTVIAEETAKWVRLAREANIQPE